MLLRTKVLSSLILSASLSTLPMLAQAQLSITNNTSQFSTTIINNVCSTALGDQGMTKPHSSNVVSDTAIQLACGFTPHNCVAHVYMTKDCTGAEMATASFDISRGVTSMNLTSAGVNSGYGVSASGFSIEFHGGPAIKAIK